MIFERIDLKHAEEAIKLAQEAYDRERNFVGALNKQDIKNHLTESIVELFSRNCGVAAIETGRLIGYISFWDGLTNHFGRVRGSFSPLHGNGIGGENRGVMASLLFQKASEEMIKDGTLSYGICTYAHDREVAESLNMNGFGIRCADAIRTLDEPFLIPMNSEFLYEELNYKNASCLLSLKNGLVRHLCQSPTFFPGNEFSEAEFEEMNQKRKSRFFIARKKEKRSIVGYIEITKDGETFISEESDTLNINGAYLEESYRGKCVLQSILSFAFEKLKAEGVKRIGVDCETINPTAIRFWSKYFETYTYSFVRRVDERILEINQLLRSPT